MQHFSQFQSCKIFDDVPQTGETERIAVRQNMKKTKLLCCVRFNSLTNHGHPAEILCTGRSYFSVLWRWAFSVQCDIHPGVFHEWMNTAVTTHALCIAFLFFFISNTLWSFAVRLAIKMVIVSFFPHESRLLPIVRIVGELRRFLEFGKQFFLRNIDHTNSKIWLKHTQQISTKPRE